jgi:hypothetical protein
MIAKSSGEIRTELESQRESLAKAVARNRAVKAYNAAIVLYNERDHAGALAAFPEARRRERGSRHRGGPHEKKPPSSRAGIRRGRRSPRNSRSQVASLRSQVEAPRPGT